MAPTVVEKKVKKLLFAIDSRYPAGFKNVRHNCITYRGVPLFPKALLPETTPFLFKRKDISLRDSLETYRELDNVQDLHAHKDSDTLAILGSGSSINELGDEEFSYISSIDSLALNWWGVYHDFVPDFYKFELGEEIAQRWIEGINEKATEYQDTVFIYEPERMFGGGENAAETIHRLDPSIRDGMVDLRIFQYFRHSSKEFRQALLGRIFPTVIRDRVLHYRGSLSQALALAYLLEYDNIILFGVDLNHSGYFFSDNPTAHKTTDQGKSEDERHATAKSTETKGIHEYIMYIKDNMFEEENKSLYIGGEQSLLYPELDHFEQLREQKA